MERTKKVGMLQVQFSILPIARERAPSKVRSTYAHLRFELETFASSYIIVLIFMDIFKLLIRHIGDCLPAMGLGYFDAYPDYTL